ncbi:MAG: efflux RND transporter periplasmic adaptor subunit [Acidobacteriaceae bacterium]|nr:efflux RND transporter periplasmic adaptor subunit [Acidobacteriaceae bacterium]
MNTDLWRKRASFFLMAGAAASLCATGCNKKTVTGGDGAPPAARVVTKSDMSLVSVDKPNLFPVVKADSYDAPAELSVTGSVFPDIAREVPVISLASGRVVDIKARLDDYVHKGQLLLKVQSPDSTAAFDTYQKAVNDERMNRKAYDRAKDLFAHGAVSTAALEQAEDAETDAQADLKAAEETLDTLGVDRHHPSPVVPVYSPISGVVIQQNVTNAAAAGVTYSGSATAFTVADLSSVWVICDVYENDIPKLALGQKASITLAAYPDRTLTGRVSDIGPVLDPSVRTAKVRIEVPNPGTLKIGMFVTATFSSLHKQNFAAVPSASILHLHDRDWVFVPAGGNQFRRVEVKSGQMVGDKQVVLSGIAPGQEVVSNVLQLETTLEAQ